MDQLRLPGLIEAEISLEVVALCWLQMLHQHMRNGDSHMVIHTFLCIEIKIYILHMGGNREYIFRYNKYLMEL